MQLWIQIQRNSLRVASLLIQPCQQTWNAQFLSANKSYKIVKVNNYVCYQVCRPPDKGSPGFFQSGQWIEGGDAVSLNRIILINSDWTAQAAASQDTKPFAKKKKKHEIRRMCTKWHRDGAFWEPDNKAANPSGNMCPVPITAGNSDSVCQRLQIILRPSLPAIFSSSQVLLRYQAFCFCFFFTPVRLTRFPLSTLHYDPFLPQTGDSELEGRAEANEACGPRGKT